MKTKYTKRLLFVLVILISVSMIGFMLSGAADPSAEVEAEEPERTILHTLDWQMKGAIVDSDGKVLEEIEFSLTGEIWETEVYTEVYVVQSHLNLVFPESLGIVFSIDERPMMSWDFSYFGLDHYVFDQLVRYKSEDKWKAETAAFAVDVESKCMIIRSNDSSERYLVASADPFVDVEEVFVRFSRFTALYKTFDEYAKNAPYTVPVEVLLKDMEALL